MSAYPAYRKLRPVPPDCDEMRLSTERRTRKDDFCSNPIITDRRFCCSLSRYVGLSSWDTYHPVHGFAALPSSLEFLCSLHAFSSQTYPGLSSPKPLALEQYTSLTSPSAGSQTQSGTTVPSLNGLATDPPNAGTDPVTVPPVGSPNVHPVGFEVGSACGSQISLWVSPSFNTSVLSLLSMDDTP